MACFLIPAGEAIVTTVAAKVIEAREKRELSGASENTDTVSVHRTPVSAKLKWLNNMLWGGSALLMLEHVWHGEVVPWFPFLTAAQDPAETAEMLSEMSTVGVSMALLVTAVWAGMAIVSSVIEKRGDEKADAAEKDGAV